MIGVQFLSQLTCEMNHVSDVDANRSLTKHRKIASSFRDTQLFEIFKLSCTLLSTARENCKNLNFNDEAQVCPFYPIPLAGRKFLSECSYFFSLFSTV